ncbi:MAG: cation transporter [Gammaproteobacteria bacterium]
MERLVARQTATLKVVLAINAATFLVMVAAAIYAGSSALLSESLDNLGDALTYGMSLYAVSLGARAKARVAVFKGASILLAAFVVLAQIGYRIWNPSVPIFEAMSGFAMFNFAANATCLALLWRHREEDVNMRSVLECSRNDMASGLAVLVAATGVWATGAAWPDLVIASALALLFFRSAYRVFSDARATMIAHAT